MSDIDPIISFGKHKGIRLSEAPADYLQWVAFGKKEQGPINHGGRDWEKLAAAELDRRKNRAPLAQGLQIQTDVNLDADGKEEERDKIKPSDLVTVTIESVNDAADHLLKEFIVRTDKKMKFSEWLVDLSKEAAKHGEHVGRIGDNIEYRYMERKFLFDLKTAALVGVKQT